MKTQLARSILALLLAGALSPAPVSAYVDVELDGNRHVVGDAYTASDTKLTVFRATGNVEVDRSAVRSIRELPGEAPAEAQSAGAAPAPATSPPGKSAPNSPVETHLDLPTIPSEREEALASSLIHLRLNRLAAQQRGDDETMKKLDEEIGSLQKERIKNYKKIDPTFEVESSD